MAGYSLPYSRLVDAQHERQRSIAAFRRSTTVFFILSLIAAVLAAGIIATLLVYLDFSSQLPVTVDSSLPSTATIAQTTTNSEDSAHILQRLNNLEREVETLRRRCGGSSRRHDKGHTRPEKPDKEHLQPESATTEQATDQQATHEIVTSVLQRLLSTTSSIQSENHLTPVEESPKASQSSTQESTISPPRSSPTSSYSTIVGPSPTPEGLLVPSVDQRTSSLMRYASHVGDLRRVARSRHDRKSRRKGQEDAALPTEEPPLRDRKSEDRGSRNSPQKRRDSDDTSCSPCTAPPTFRSAAHFEGQRNGNVLITHEAGLIREPRAWGYADWMTQLDKDKFQLSITQEVTVAEGGIYYIYSQIMFYDNNYAVGQSIGVNDRPLFTCTKSNISAEAKQSTCSLGGLTRLSAGDRLGIQLSVPNIRIAMYPDQSFFGLFKLAS